MFYTKKEKSKTTDEEAGLSLLRKKRLRLVNVEGGFAFHFLDIFIGEGDPESGVACKGKFF